MRWFRHVFGFLSIMLLSATLIASWVAGLVPFDFWTPEVQLKPRYVRPTVYLSPRYSTGEADIESEISRIELEITKVQQSKLPEQGKKIKIRELKLDQKEKELELREMKLEQPEHAAPQQPQSLRSADPDETKKTDDNSLLTGLGARIIALLGFLGLLSGAIQMIIYTISAVSGLSRLAVSKQSEL